MSLEPPVLEFSQWVPWKAERCETPEWWPEVSVVPGRDESRKLAREVWASFVLPWQMQELGSREATLQAPPALQNLYRQKFMLQAKSIYACRDIREVPQEKWWCTLGPSSIGWSKIICLLEVGHDYWWKACWSWGRRWNGTCPSLTKRSSRGWPSPRRKRRRVQRPLQLQTSPRHPMCQSHLWKREPQHFWDGRRYYIHPNQWWLPGRSPQPTKTLRPKVGSSQPSQMIPIKPPVSPPRIHTPP